MSIANKEAGLSRRQRLYRVEERVCGTNIQYVMASSKDEACGKYCDRDVDEAYADTKDEGNATVSVKAFLAKPDAPADQNDTAILAFRNLDA